MAPVNWQPVLMDRDGNVIGTFLKGDPYLRDLKFVKGHTSALTSVMWHPHNKTNFLTSSFDSTVRIWDYNFVRSSKCCFFTNTNGTRRYAMTAAVFSSDGRQVISGDDNGFIRIWNSEYTSSTPQMSISAHAKGLAITRFINWLILASK